MGVALGVGCGTSFFAAGAGLGAVRPRGVWPIVEAAAPADKKITSKRERNLINGSQYLVVLGNLDKSKRTDIRAQI
jgi:hypothetical protein